MTHLSRDEILAVGWGAGKRVEEIAAYLECPNEALAMRRWTLGLADRDIQGNLLATVTHPLDFNGDNVVQFGLPISRE